MEGGGGRGGGREGGRKGGREEGREGVNINFTKCKHLNIMS